MDNPITMRNLLINNQQKFIIPLYQRNFSWDYIEIAQLIADIADSINDREKYYIGTLVVCRNDLGDFDIIDGQQRYTAVILISLAIQNSKHLADIQSINLFFKARQKSNDTLLKILRNENLIEDNELLYGYNVAVAALKEQFPSGDYTSFYNYLLDSVYLFVDEMPKETDVNLYFERFNSRGEQLEAHEVIKTELMQRLLSDNCDIVTIQKFAKIWDACSEFETPCIKFFKKKIKATDVDAEREKIFKCDYIEYEPGKSTWLYQFTLNNVYKDIVVNNENKESLISILGIENVPIVENDSESSIEEFIKYRCIVNFNTFLYYVLYITDGMNEVSSFDDKKLKNAFRIQERNKDWILKFGENLIKAKFIFDSFIIRNSLETTARQKEGEWFLQKVYREDKNDKRRGHLYVQTRFEKNSFEVLNDEILMLQSMLAVTFTAYKDTKWLFSTLKYLFNNAKKLSYNNFGREFYNYLENLTKQYAKERFCGPDNIDKNQLRYDYGVPVYAFNLMDYVLWKNREEVKKKYGNIKFENFRFSYRRSIEHWYPQKSNEREGHIKMSSDLLHSFGNLCIIVASQNSAFGNLYPDAKYSEWRQIFDSQSLKLQMMAAKTEEWGRCWDESKKTDILAMEDELIKMLYKYIFG